LADIIRARFSNPQATLHELFARMVFNVLVGNTDDHARNHAAFWDGEWLALTPAYDICPQRAREERPIRGCRSMVMIGAVGWKPAEVQRRDSC